MSDTAFAFSFGVYAVFSTCVLIVAQPADRQQKHEFMFILLISSLFSSIILGVCLTMSRALCYIHSTPAYGMGCNVALTEYLTIPAAF